MSPSEMPPFLPFTDEEGYYVRDPKAVFNRTDAEFRAFETHFQALLDGVQRLDANRSPEQQAIIEQLKNDLQLTQGSTKLLLSLMRELATYNTRLTEQRQSARKAFETGWEARYMDILSQLHPEDQRMLRWIIEHIAATDSSDEL